ncbi:hypothetical protein SGO26_20015 [Cupriavidus metallidurans]|uniref:hypothetical protein n=1 Tax=Cupriavidus TaxID=106589 RepID=UPI002579BE00|nr:MULTISPECIES: hypothetical protein [unclassified Cupriavidus]
MGIQVLVLVLALVLALALALVLASGLAQVACCPMTGRCLHRRHIRPAPQGPKPMRLQCEGVPCAAGEALRPWKRVMLKRSFVKDGCMSFHCSRVLGVNNFVFVIYYLRLSLMINFTNNFSWAVIMLWCSFLLWSK